MKKLEWSIFKEYCSRTGKKPSHYNSVLDFQSERVFEDNAGDYYFDSLDDVEWSDIYGSYVFYGIDLEFLTELE